MKNIITIIFALLLFTAGINAQQVAAKPGADKQLRAEQRAKATAAIQAYNATEHKAYPVSVKHETKTEVAVAKPVTHTAEYNKRAAERAENAKPVNEKNKKFTRQVQAKKN